MKEKVVVTGGWGFIGSHLVDALVERGYEVHVVDNAEKCPPYINEKAIQHRVSVTHTDSMFVRIFEGARCVFHLAALPRVVFSIQHPLRTDRVNIGGTLSVLEASSKAGVSRVVYSSSSSVYGEQEGLPFHEDMSVNPMSPYAIQKYVGELYCAEYSRQGKVDTVSLRYFNVYGPRQSALGAYACVIPKFLKQKKEGQSLTVTGDGTQTRDFTHSDDVVRANLLAMEYGDALCGDIFNVGAGEGVRVCDIAHFIHDDIIFIAPRDEPHRTHASCEKIRKRLGWEPTVLWQEGIARLMEEPTFS
ncbi:MAG: NAD-dependent epimerase/dehydratase family protein [Candidatus Paceibacterota bacterium]